MRPGGGKAKGSDFERRMCKKFSLWMTDGADDTQLIRSDLSGGWAKGKAAPEGWRQAGDLSPNGEAGTVFCSHFAMECKDRAEFNWWHIFSADKPHDGNLLGWWMQAVASVANHPTVVPLLVAKALRSPVVVGLPLDVYQPPRGVRYMAASIMDHDVVFVDIDDFLKVRPETYYMLVRKWRST